MSSPVVSIDARTGDPRAELGTLTTIDELNQICERAGAQFDGWRRTSRAERAKALGVIADALDAAADDLVAIADAETALGEVRLRGEVGRTTGQLRFFGRVITEGSYLEATIDHADGSVAPPRPDLRLWLEPVGVVGVFGASNFPFAFSSLGGDSAAALAAGAPVVTKAHSSHPQTATVVVDIARAALEAAGYPPDLIQVIHGREAGVGLVAHPVIKAVGFTGSLGGGKALARIAAERPVPIPFHGELGSVNPVVVTEKAAAERPDQIGQDLAGAVLLGAGQFCTKPGLLLVPEGKDGDRVVSALGTAITAAPGFHLLDKGIAASYREGIAGLAGRDVVERLATGNGDGRQVPAALHSVRAEDLDDEIAEECFGPTTLVVRYGDQADLPAILRRLDPSLTTTLQYAEGEPIADLVDALAAQSGRVIFNGVPTGVAVTWAMTHGGPWPATTSPYTSVGASAIRRFLRPVSFQNAPEEVLPDELRDGSVTIPTRIDGVLVLPTAADGAAGGPSTSSGTGEGGAGTGTTSDMAGTGVSALFAEQLATVAALRDELAALRRGPVLPPPPSETTH